MQSNIHIKFIVRFIIGYQSLSTFFWFFLFFAKVEFQTFTTVLMFLIFGHNKKSIFLTVILQKMHFDISDPILETLTTIWNLRNNLKTASLAIKVLKTKILLIPMATNTTSVNAEKIELYSSKICFVYHIWFKLTRGTVGG